MISLRKLSLIAQLILLVLIGTFSINAAGEVDTTFSGSALGELTNQGNVNVVKFQPDGRILVGGMFTEVQGYAASGLARLNADGTVDRTFNAPDFASQNSGTGAVTLGGDIYAIAVQPDGKILVGGNIYLGTIGPGGFGKGIRRLNADGSIDLTFFIELMLPGSDVYEIKLQSDGKILIGGLFTIASSTTTKNLARLNADGSRDTTFLANTSNAQIKGLEIQPDGKIVAGGHSLSGTPSVATSFVGRFNTDGSADSLFTPITSGNGTVEAIKLQSDGKTLVSGNYTSFGGLAQSRVSRLNTDGTLDQGFNVSGAGASAVVNDIAIRPDGKIIIGGNFSSFNGTAMQRIARLNTDGTLDNTFTNSGTITDTPVNDVEILSDNRILAGLNTSTLIDPLLRFSADGAFDSSFVVRANRGGTVNNMVQQPDGKILVAGEFLYANGVMRRSLARFDADGTLDPSFVPYFNNLPVIQLIYAIALQPDGKIIVGSWHGIVLQRLNADGSQDTSFNTPLTSSSQVYDVAMQADGKILVGGNLTIPNAVKFTRLNSDGSRDTAFNPAQPSNFVRKIIIQPDGNILIGGAFSQISDIALRNGVARYNPDGVLDNSFNPPGPGLSPVVDIDLQTDGKIVVCGNGLRRLNTNGSLDSSLNKTSNSDVIAVKIQPDGKILVGGDFTVIANEFRNGIARFNADGTLDNGFTTSANRSVRDVQLQPDGKILIGGKFTKINGLAGGRVARLLNVDTFVPEPTLFDYDGDGRADVSVFRPSTNRWFEFLSGNSTVTEQNFGISGDIITPADFDGDDKTDLAIFRPSTGDWWYLSSFNNIQVRFNWGLQGDIPRPSDFDGDGKADYVLFRPSNNNWYRSGSAGTVSIINFGLAGDKPVTGDFDGDGKSDLANYRPSTGTWWYRSSINSAFIATQWGISTDIPTPADFDGDGKTDLAVYRPSTGIWYIINSGNGSFTIINFGLSEDKPVAADYDGDGKADIAVFRPSTGVWYQLRSTEGFFAQQFGLSTDIPTENAFIP